MLLGSTREGIGLLAEDSENIGSDATWVKSGLYRFVILWDVRFQ